MASLSHGRPSTSDEYGSEAAAGGATPSGRRDAPDGSPWEAKSPGDSPRSRIPGPMGSLTGEQRQASLLQPPGTAARLSQFDDGTGLGLQEAACTAKRWWGRRLSCDSPPGSRCDYLLAVQRLKRSLV